MGPAGSARVRPQIGGGSRLRRDDLRGKRTVLYFYPKDDTPGCTLEGREFTALLDDFRGAGVDVYGVSPDSPRSHAALPPSVSSESR